MNRTLEKLNFKLTHYQSVDKILRFDLIMFDARPAYHSAEEFANLRWSVSCDYPSFGMAGRAKTRNVPPGAGRVSLYVRLSISFFTHRKTAALFTLIGADAYWIPPRLWTYAATHQPDGDFTKYSDKEIALLIAYHGDASSMLQALQKSGFMDGMKIHGWREHNAYHSVFAERATKAANARWRQRGKRKDIEKKGKEIEQASVKHASSMNGSEAEKIYGEYPLKVGKPHALRAISKALSKRPFEVLLARTKSFAATRHGDLNFCPNPATWFNEERYDDDPSTWLPKHDAKPKTGRDPDQLMSDKLWQQKHANS